MEAINLVKLNEIWLQSTESYSENLTLYISMELCETRLKDVIIELQNDFNLLISKVLTLLGYFVASHLFIDF
jgi:hypothetical protein